MGTTAFVFPGQGSQYVGMGKDLYEQLPEARERFDQADALLGFSLSKICFEGPEDDLKQTKNTQPAIFLHSMVAADLYRGDRAAMTAGHSLGEYSALVYAGALTFEDGLRLVRLRGELMQQAGIERPGTMAAVVGLGPDAVGDVCRTASSAGIVQSANFNSPGQIVISGSVSGVRKAMELAKRARSKTRERITRKRSLSFPLDGICGKRTEVGPGRDVDHKCSDPDLCECHCTAGPGGH